MQCVTPKHCIVPILLVILGFAALNVPVLHSWNLWVRHWFLAYGHGKTGIENYLQYICAVVFLLVPGKHAWRERLLLFASALLLFQGVSESIKFLTGVIRPDGSSPNSFPSGHTGTAFVSATLLTMEALSQGWGYIRNFPWIGIVAYFIACTTGFLRMFHNRHWFNDVEAGAGLGILIAFLVWSLWNHYRQKKQ